MNAGFSAPMSLSRSASLGVGAGLARPERSPFTSAMNTGTPMRAQALGEHLQGDGLAGAGGAGDEPVAVGKTGQQDDFGVLVSGKQQGIGHRKVLGGAGVAAV